MLQPRVSVHPDASQRRGCARPRVNRAASPHAWPRSWVAAGTKSAPRILVLVALLGAARLGAAHCLYKDLLPGVPLEDYWAGNRAWTEGTRAVLGDSHHVLGAGSYFYKFHLDGESVVTVVLATATVERNGQTYPAGLDPAFSLYRGVLPLYGHDDTPDDPTNPVDEVNFLPVASPRDAAPDGHVYAPHDGYRDTLTFETTGGLYTPANDGGNPDLDGTPVNPFAGQFDALGDWSMANEWAVPGLPTVASGCPAAKCPNGNPVGDWAELTYVAHRNDHVGAGTTPDTTAEVLDDQDLEAGDYTVVVGGGCPGCAPTGLFGGRLGVTVHAVPQPPACASAPSAPEIAVLANPLDGAVGDAMSWVRITAASCDGGAVTIQLLKGPPGATLSPTTPAGGSGRYMATLGWTPTAAHANRKFRLAVRAAGSGGRTDVSPVSKTVVRVFPAGSSPTVGAVRAFKGLGAVWDAHAGTLVVSGQIVPLALLTRDERTALLQGPLELRVDDGNLGGAVLDTLTPASSGRFRAAIPLTPAAVPCGVTAVFDGARATRGVKHAPASCVN